MLYFLCGTCCKYETKGENKVLKIRNQEVVFGVLSCIFAVILIVVIFVNKNIIDFIYLGIISILFFKYFIEIRRN